MKRKLLLLLAVVATTVIGAQAATKYEINVGGVEVTSDNYNNVTGGDIKSGTVKYDPSSKTLTLTNVTITRTGGSNYGIHNRNCTGLTMKFVGTCNVSSNTANALHFDATTTLFLNNGCTLNASITAGENYGRGVIYVNNKALFMSGDGSGTLNITGKMKEGGSRSSCATCGFEGKGQDSNTWLVIDGVNVVMDVTHDGIYKFGEVEFDYTTGTNRHTDVKIKFDYGFRALDKVGKLRLNYGVACVTPADATFNSNDGSLGGNDYYTHFTNNYGVIFSTANFPDDNFRTYMRSLCGVDSYSGKREQYLTPSQLQNLTSLVVGNKSISNLTGVSLLTNLTELDCCPNNLTSLPTLPSGLKSLNCAINKLTYLPTLPSGLKELACYNNQLTSLPTLPSSLQSLSCSNNKLTSLPALPSGLTVLDCGNNNFTSLTVTGKSYLKTLTVQNNTGLTSLNCSDNILTRLDVSGCTVLENLQCGSNDLATLDVSGCGTKLYYLNCSGNRLSSLDFTQNGNIREIYCNNNQLTSLKLPAVSTGSSRFNYVQKLYCQNNQLNSTASITNLQYSSFLTTLDCSSNKLTSLSSLPSSLESLSCGNNLFTSLSITGMTKLKYLSVYNSTSLTALNCSGNALTDLNYGGCSELVTLSCDHNQLSVLSSLYSKVKVLRCNSNKLTGLPALPDRIEEVYCGENQLSALILTGRSNLKTLSVSNSPNLARLHCPANALTMLDISGCSELTELYCNENKLTSLNLTNFGKLADVRCYRNELNSLTVQGNTALKTLNAFSNNLTSLSVQGCSALNYLNIRANQIKESAMTSLVNSMRTIPASENMGTFYVYGENYSTDKPEGNVITTAQAKTAKDKRWLPQHKVGDGWVDIPTSGGMRGDVNGDGSVDVDDMNIVINIMVNKASFANWPAADVDGSGNVDVDDLNIIINIMVGKG